MSLTYLTDDLLVKAYCHFICARSKFAAIAVACVGEELIRRGVSIEIFDNSEEKDA